MWGPNTHSMLVGHAACDPHLTPSLHCRLPAHSPVCNPERGGPSPTTSQCNADGSWSAPTGSGCKRGEHLPKTVEAAASSTASVTGAALATCPPPLAVCVGQPPALAGVDWSSCIGTIVVGKTCSGRCSSGTPFGSPSVYCGNNGWDAQTLGGRCSATPGARAFFPGAVVCQGNSISAARLWQCSGAPLSLCHVFCLSPACCSVWRAAPGIAERALPPRVPRHSVRAELRGNLQRRWVATKSKAQPCF
jgi:hypothetical protein